jgi:hypothetical protein
MDINDLKKAWDQYSANEKGKDLDKEAISEMLRGRTKGLIDKIERNIRIGFYIILALIIFFVADDFFISPVILNGISADLDVPGWIVALDVLTNLAIIVTFIIFVRKYYQAKKDCDMTCDLADTLRKIIKILNLYQRLFYYTIFIILISTASSFIAGFLKSIEYSAQISGVPSGQMNTFQIIFSMVIGLIFLLLLSYGLFVLFRWGFRKLYGNYLKKLQLTLAELNEKVEETEVS